MTLRATIDNKVTPFIDNLVKGDVRKNAEAGIAYLNRCLTFYADKREKTHYVGQFLDKTGIEENQSGIFGISCWVIMTEGAKNEKIENLRNACIEALKEFVINSEKEGQAGEDLIYLRYNTFKIAFAIEAVISGQCSHEAEILLKRIIDRRDGEGVWGFALDVKDSNCISTAFIVRSIAGLAAGNERVQSILYDALIYLSDKYTEDPNIYEQLFILNTIQIGSEYLPDEFFKDNQHKKIDARSKIKDLVKELYLQVRLNPTKFPNPINIDYHFQEETYYFRLPPSGIILLEALTLISGPSLIYLYAYVGRRIFKDLMTNLDSNYFVRDISDHRASCSVFYYKYHLLQLIIKRGKAKFPTPNFIRRIISNIACAFYFGANMPVNTTLVLTFCILGLFSVSFNEKFGWLLFGVASKSLVDIIKDVYSLNTVKK